MSEEELDMNQLIAIQQLDRRLTEVDERIGSRIDRQIQEVKDHSDAGTEAVSERLDVTDRTLRDHILAQVDQIREAMEGARTEARLARQATDERIVAVKEYLTVLIEAEADRTSEGDLRLREHIKEQVAQISEALDSARRETGFANEAAKEAISKAETASEKRFESVNEFRAQLTDQTSTFLPRETFESVVAGWDRWRAQTDARLNEQAGSERAVKEVGSQRAATVGQVGVIAGLVVAALGVMGTVAGILVGAFT